MSYMYVMLGGALGAALRYGLSLWMAPIALGLGFPVATLLANVLGSFVLGVLLELCGRGIWPEVVRLSVGVGVLGAFTTFSTFSVETEQLWAAGQQNRAVVYAVLSVLGGVLAAFLGRLVALTFVAQSS